MNPKGATGVMVRTLLEYLLSAAAEPDRRSPEA